MTASPGIRGRGWILAAWALCIAAAAVFSARLPSVLQGGADAIPGSGSDRTTRLIRQHFGAGVLYQFPIVVSSDSFESGDSTFAAAIERLTATLIGSSKVARVETAWNSERSELLGDDGRSALVLVTPRVETFYEAEQLTATLRAGVAKAAIPSGMRAEVTGAAAMLHDLDERSSADLLEAERIALPITAVILLVVFRTPLAAGLPILLALASTSIGLAGLYLLSARFTVSVFAQNVVSMVGLGVGVDYALFVISRFREARARGLGLEPAAREARTAAGHSVMLSGVTVAVGFLALFLVRAPFLHAIALGGVLVVVAAVAAAMTLLPALLVVSGSALDWPRRAAPPASLEPSAFWSRWAHRVMQRPWLWIAGAMAVLAVFLVPLPRMAGWNIGAADLPESCESRRGYDTLKARFSPGWMGPIVLVVESRGLQPLTSDDAYHALLPLFAEVESDPRSGRALGLHRVLSLLRMLPPDQRDLAHVPAESRGALSQVLSADGRVGIMAWIPTEPPESRAMMRYVAELREKRWPAAEQAGLVLHWGGSSAIMQDFDAEMFGSARRVIVAVVLSTFLLLVLLLRSVFIPLKATLLNALSVLSAYGFLILVFQDGHGAHLLGLTPPGGLNSFIVLMLFTILFGLSMDYEVFLLSRIREEYAHSQDNDQAVAAGLARTGGIITSAALIMVTIFAAFGFTRLVPTREFGLGLAFAVALDATLLRIVLVPALMKVSGRLNWWWPGSGRR